MCVRAYIKGLKCLRQCINTHEAACGAERRVRVSQHTHITPPLSLSLPSINPSSLPLTLHLLFFMWLKCLFMRKTRRDFAWQANCDLLVMITRQVTNGVNKNGAINRCSIAAAQKALRFKLSSFDAKVFSKRSVTPNTCEKPFR